MTKPIVILGYGPVGQAAAAVLLGEGRAVRIAQRSAPQHLPRGASFARCDVTDRDSLAAAISGADQVVAAFGFAYDGAVWLRDWPRTMHNLVETCAAENARLVFFDNLYMYGPQTVPLTEDMPLSNHGRKPRARSEATRIRMAARDAGRVKIAALRAPDFYGPGVANSHLGELGFGALAKGKAASLILPPDTPHDFA
jgi:nucleoside-diphosphate-sugar epimerase